MKKEDIFPQNESQIALKTLWDNIDGEIHIIYPALNQSRWAKELHMLFKDHLTDDKLISPYLKSLDGSKELALWISRFGPHITSGDIYACMHVIMLLSIFYGPELIRLKEAFCLESQIKKGMIKDLKNNLVLIGGPSGNPITNKILNDCGLHTIFPNAPENDFKVVMPDMKEFSPDPSPNNPSLLHTIKDIGVFLKMKNPYDSNKFVFAAMGSNSWGTQGAASIACSSEGAQIIDKIAKSTDNNNSNIDILACINVFKNQNNDDCENEDNRKIEYKLCWPIADDNILTNPLSLNQALSENIQELRDAATSDLHIVSPFGWGRAVFAMFFIFIFGILVTLLSLNKLQFVIYFPISLLALYFAVYCFLRLPRPKNY